jgi:hypothetical protein
MTHESFRPLNWNPFPGLGYTVTRRLDGGMHFTFTNTTPETLDHWRSFALQHLYESDRLTRNLYDLRQLTSLPDQALQYAVEVNSDPSTRNIRLAVVVATEDVRQSIFQIADLTTPSGLDMAIFTDIEEAEAWLSRPLTVLL